MARRSQVQKQVLILYRSLLRESAQRPGMKEYIREEFQKHKDIPRTNTIQIEYLLRRGNKRLKEMKTGQMVSMSMFGRKDDVR